MSNWALRYATVKCSCVSCISQVTSMAPAIAPALHSLTSLFHKSTPKGEVSNNPTTEHYAIRKRPGDHENLPADKTERDRAVSDLLKDIAEKDREKQTFMKEWENYPVAEEKDLPMGYLGSKWASRYASEGLAEQHHKIGEETIDHLSAADYNLGYVGRHEHRGILERMAKDITDDHRIQYPDCLRCAEMGATTPVQPVVDDSPTRPGPRVVTTQPQPVVVDTPTQNTFEGLFD